MKKILVTFLACITFTIVFTACTGKFFPRKITYNVVQGSSNTSSLPSMPLKAVAYKNDIKFYADNKLAASFTVIGPSGPLPPPPQPCEPGDRCHKISVLMVNNKFTFTVDDDKTSFLLKTNVMNDLFMGPMKEAPNSLFILQDPNFIDK